MLAYCIAEQQSQIRLPPRGVEGAQIEGIDVGMLRCFVSDFDARMHQGHFPEMVKDFSQVLQRIFEQASIIPFRFPTVVESEEVLRQFVEGRSVDYRSALHQLRNKVQMDLRVTLESGGTPEYSMQSGRSYLEHRRARYQEAQSILKEFRRASDSLAEKWVQHDTPSGIRGFALVDRSSLPVFLEKIGRVVTPGGISARITGPWPPSEFVETAHE